MRIAMVGAEYVGPVSGACLADFGHEVVCVYSDNRKIDALRGGNIPIFEPGLDELVARNVEHMRLSFETDLGRAVQGAQAVFIAVGTPSRRGDGHADLTFLHRTATEIARTVDGYTVIATKSTVPVGTGDDVERIIQEAHPDADVSVVSNPEFLGEGVAIEDFKRPDRIIIGIGRSSAHDPRASEVMSEIYRPLFLNQSPLLFTSRRSADALLFGAVGHA